MWVTDGESRKIDSEGSVNLLKIGNRTVGDGNPSFIIAEAGINHNGSLEVAKKMIDVAVDAGADCVKFQKRDLHSLYTPSILENPNIDSQGLYNLISILKEVELSEQRYEEIVAYCKQKGIMFLCTPWDRKSVDFLESLEVNAYKIASADLTNIPLIRHVASKGKPMILSTGMSIPEEIDRTVKFLKDYGAQFALLHCNSTYPAPYKDINLKFMLKLKEMYGVDVGYSGHDRGNSVSFAAVAMGASIVERHFTLDRTMKGPDHAASLEPLELKSMIENIRTIETAMGQPIKRLSRGEVLTRETLAKSIVARTSIKKGQIITAEMIDVRGPGKGLSPQFLDLILNSIAARDFNPDELFMEEDMPEVQKNA